MSPYAQCEHTTSPWWLVLVAPLYWMSTTNTVTGA